MNSHKSKPYTALALVLAIHFVIMYLLVFVPVNTAQDIKFFNLRNFYKALIMVAPMAFLMLIFMRHMYQDKKLNILIYSLSVIVFISTFFFIREQTFVGNEQFIKSMIPHHSSAITMCEESKLTDQELRELCDEIISGQQDEINQMNRILERLNS